MHVLVVGGTRFAGYLLVWRLLAAGHRVTLFNRGTMPDPWGDRVERLRGDRTTAHFGLILGNREFDAAVDFAAFTEEDARGAVSVLGGRVGHYVFISSGQVYLVRDDCPRPAKEADYDGPLLPRPESADDARQWDYGAGKRACEDILARAWADLGFPATRLRLPMINGERDPERRMETYLWRLLDGGPLLVPDGGMQVCRHVYAAEVARAVASILGDSATFGQAYNVAQDETRSTLGLLALLSEVVGVPQRLVPVSSADLAERGIATTDISPFSGRWMSYLDPNWFQTERRFRHEPLRQYLGHIVASFLANPPASPPDNYRHRPVELELAARLS